MITTLTGARIVGIGAVPVNIETEITVGIGIHLIGLADAAVKESLLRTVTALMAMGYSIPGKKVIINLAPAELHKSGSGYDLPIALGLLAASGQAHLPALNKFLIMGELGLDAEVRAIAGGLPITELAKRMGKEAVILPLDSAREAREIDGIRVYAVRNLQETISILENDAADSREDLLIENIKELEVQQPEVVDFKDIYGHYTEKRALEIAAAGGHNIIFMGAPGSGKSTLARALMGILPPISLEETLEVSRVYSVAGKGVGKDGLVRNRPFRAPHFSASLGAMFGGGAGENIQPGEVSLADRGVLYLDEMPQWPKAVLEALRGPLEDGKITISRLKSKVEYPARFQLVASSNPCPCGYYSDGDKCTCTPAQRAAYLARLDGPVMDRIDMQVWAQTPKPLPGVNTGTIKGESSVEVATRVAKAREIQAKRYMTLGIETNAQLTYPYLETYCPLNDECKELLERLVVQLGLSARAFTRILRIARTIADLAGEKDIKAKHLCEAAWFRFLDRNSCQ